MIFLAIYVVCGGILQFICFHYATLKCGGGKPDDNYPFPGGGHGHPWTGLTGPADNLVPRRSIVVEREPLWYGMAFDVYNATAQGTIAGAPTGTWFRTWGPFFSTYTFQDVQNSQPTIYMRASIQSMIFKYNDDWAMRCDGKGTPMRLSEGQHWLMNRIRNLLGFNQGYTFKVWANVRNCHSAEELASTSSSSTDTSKEAASSEQEDTGSKEAADSKEATSPGQVCEDSFEIVAYAEETFHGAKSITFRNATEEKGVDPEFASAVMLGSKFEQDDKKFTQWLVKNQLESTIPFWQTNSMSVLYAFRLYNMQQKVKTAKKKENHQPNMLAEAPHDPSDVK